jgi:hypothetical protein
MKKEDESIINSFNLTLSLLSLKCDAYNMTKYNNNIIGEQLLFEVKKVVSSVSSIDKEYMQNIIDRIDRIDVNEIYKKAAKDMFNSIL